MIVAFIVDLTSVDSSGAILRKKVLDEIRLGCKQAKAQLQIVPYEGVAHGKADYLDPVYNSDVLIMDMSSKTQQGVLLYHLGVRENMKLFDNIVLVTFTSGKSNEDITTLFEQSTRLIPYTLTKVGALVSLDVSAIRSDIWEDESLKEKLCVGRSRLSEEIYVLLCETESSNRAPIKEKFLADLRTDRENFKGEELRQRLRVIRSRLDDPELLSPDIILNMLLSYRDCEDFAAMVKLIDDVRSLKMQSTILDSSMFTYLYAFALNGRKKSGDREEALKVIKELLETCKKPSADMFGLLGRIYKDRFLESDYKDDDALKAAIESYRRGFLADPNEYLGVNLATLLVCSGQELSSSMELRSICNQLNRQIGRKGDISKLTDYWDLATLFEVRVLSENYSSAVVVLDRIFSLDPPAWQLNSTMRNIKLICHFRKPTTTNVRVQKSRKLFDFWMEFLSSVDVSDGNGLNNKDNPVSIGLDSYRTEYPVLVTGTPNDRWEPAFLQLNIESEPKFLRISFYDRDKEQMEQTGVGETPEDESIRMLENCLSSDEDHVFHVEDIKGISLTKRYPRHAFLFTVFQSHDYALKFSCERVRFQFYSVVCEQLLSSDQIGDLILEDETQAPIEFEYENNKDNVLGRGAYGTVYIGRELATQRKIAIKEITSSEPSQHQQMLEEIRLHSRLHHDNIVHYLGAVVKNGKFVILMELVPGGSLTSLLKKHGALEERTVSNYSMQILKGLQYLHRNRIIHRDIKADNILINQYSGLVKLSDFGLSKRLIGIEARAMSFKGTCQYMAPELINNQRGYDFPIDIWSFGCTVVQMLQGTPPFNQFENPYIAVFRVGKDAEHPEIPDSVTAECRDFVLRTFTPNPSERATAAQLLLHPFIEPLIRTKRKLARPSATYGHGPSRRSPLAQIQGVKYERFISAMANPGGSGQPETMREPKSGDNHLKLRITVEELTSGFVPPTTPTDVSNALNDGRSSSVPDDLDMDTLDASVPPVGSKRDRLAIEAKQLPRLNLPIRVQDDSSESIRPVETPAVPSSTPEAFKYVKQDNELKALLSERLASLRKTVVSIWHENLISSGTRLPLQTSTGGMKNGFGDGDPPDQLVKVAEPNGSACHSSELELLDCLLDMLLDHLRGGTVWNSISKYVARSSATSDRPDSVSARFVDSAGSELGERFATIIQQINDRGYRDDVSLFTSSWLFTFLNAALDKIWTSFEKPLCGHLESPHILFAWHKFIRDAVGSALIQLAAANRYADLNVSNISDGPVASGRVTLRRNRTLVGRGGPSTISQRGFSYRPRSDIRCYNKLDGRARPISFTYRSTQKYDGARVNTVNPAVAPGVNRIQDDPGRRRISFRTGDNDGPLPTLSEPEVTEDIVDESDQEQSHFPELGSDIDLDTGMEQTHKLKNRLNHVVSELNGLLKSVIQQKETEIEQIRQYTPEVSFHDTEMTTGFSNVWEWFTSMQLPQNDLNTLLDNVNNESDFLAMVTKEDLYKMNLSFSAVMRVWRAVVRIREAHRNEVSQL